MDCRLLRGSLFVSPSELSDKPGINCDSAKYSSIQAAVNAAAPGNTIVVCTGVYYEEVTVSKPLTLRGFDAVINASAKNNGVLVTASGTTVTGLTVENAIGEGILAVGVSNVASKRRSTTTATRRECGSHRP